MSKDIYHNNKLKDMHTHAHSLQLARMYMADSFV